MKTNGLTDTIQKNYYFPNYSSWIFAALFLIFSIIYNYQNILFKSPQSLHLWRQCDCLSITMNYYQDNNRFFEPAIHNLGNDGTGKTASDFPLIYFFVAQLWKVFGFHEFIYRLIVLLFFFSGLFALFKIFEKILMDSVLAITSSLYLFTSPTLVYYANNFLMDIPVFAFFYAVAGLLKISSLLSFIAIVGIFILELFSKKLSPGKKIFQNSFRQILILISVVIVQIIWYRYAALYNMKNNGGIFLIGTLPIWDSSIPQVKVTLDAIREHIKWDYFREETQEVIVFMFVSILLFYKKINKILLFLTVSISIGVLLYILLFFQALKDHDYYTINLFILIPFILLSFLLLLKDKFNSVYTSVLFRILVIAFLVHNIDFSRRRIEGRYNSKGWENETYIENIQSYKDISPYLRSIGINKNDKIISLSDNTINSSLYFMNQKGWTNWAISGDSVKIREKINFGAKYLLINNTRTYEEQGVQPFIKNKIGEFKNIDIYAL